LIENKTKTKHIVIDKTGSEQYKIIQSFDKYNK